jgi:predicted dehydrogenase
MDAPIRYGLIGCGGFGRFCLEAYRPMASVRLIGLADANAALARKTAADHQLEFCASPEALLAHDDIDLIHIASPPSTHANLALAALQAGKHVLCEKPLALTVSEAERMIALASRKSLTLGVNLIMRYNPLASAVKRLITSGVLGEPLFAALVNAAQDELLPAQHWFWNPAESGGIFVEHGVHFFDLFEWWFGEGEILSAHDLSRPHTQFVEQVICTARYGRSTLASFYHGFHQMLRRDRQSWQIVCECGVITMTEWVPTDLHLDATLNEAQLQTVRSILPEATAEILEQYSGDQRVAASRHQTRTVDVRASITARAGTAKMEVYGDMLRSLLDDQIAAIRDPGHARLVDDRNGLSSLRYALAATHLARQQAGRGDRG